MCRCASECVSASMSACVRISVCVGVSVSVSACIRICVRRCVLYLCPRVRVPICPRACDAIVHRTSVRSCAQTALWKVLLAVSHRPASAPCSGRPALSVSLSITAECLCRCSIHTYIEYHCIIHRYIYICIYKTYMYIKKI